MSHQLWPASCTAAQLWPLTNQCHRVSTQQPDQPCHTASPWYTTGSLQHTCTIAHLQSRVNSCSTFALAALQVGTISALGIFYVYGDNTMAARGIPTILRTYSHVFLPHKKHIYALSSAGASHAGHATNPKYRGAGSRHAKANRCVEISLNCEIML